MDKGNNASIIAMWISLISNVLLTGTKIAVGFVFHSQVLLADGVHNAGDVIATAAALSSMRISKQPADKDHPYGHGKAEVLGSGIVAIVLGLAALYMGTHAVMALFAEPAQANVVALAAAFVSLVWKLGLYMYTVRIARSTHSKGLNAAAYDHLADVYASIAAVVGIALSLLGDAYRIPYLSYGDAAAGVIVSVLVLKLSVHLGREAVDILMEKAVNEERLGEYAKLIRSVNEVKRIDRLRARELGHYILVDVRISVPAELSIQQGHDVSRSIKKAIMDRHDDVGEVLIHINPWYEPKRR